MSRRAIIFSVLLHVIILVALLVTVDFHSKETNLAPPASTVVRAKAIDSAALAHEVQQLKAKDDAARAAQEKKAKEAERKAREAEQKRQDEERKIKDLKAEQERLKKEQAEEVQRAADAKQKAAEAERVAEEKKKDEAARKRKDEAERKEAERKRAEQTMQDEIAAEEAAAQDAADTNELSKYQVAIYNRVRQSWTILPGTDGLTCSLRITLVPGGEVAGVEIVKSSGNATFDRQAENAVRKAAPLPVPSESRLFQKMRSITFVFSPQS